MKNKKRIVILSLVLSVLVLAAVFLIRNVSFGFSNLFTEAYGAMSLSFDKQAMQSVNRVVITADGKTVEITDPALIGEIVAETAAATHMKFGCPEDKQIDLYCDDRLIRSMGWSSCCDTVNVYDSDRAHWVISIEGSEEGGSVYLSPGLLERLTTAINTSK